MAGARCTDLFLDTISSRRINLAGLGQVSRGVHQQIWVRLAPLVTGFSPWPGLLQLVVGLFASWFLGWFGLAGTGLL